MLGGARSGKSRFAQQLASTLGGKVLFVATAEALDDEMQSRIEAHRRERPAGWRTLECPQGVSDGIRTQAALQRPDVVILDCITLLVSNLLTRVSAGAADDHERRVAGEIDALVRCIEESSSSFIIVSNEVGLGLVPDAPLGRAYRDALGRANQRLASCAAEVYFMVAGIPLKVKEARLGAG